MFFGKVSVTEIPNISKSLCDIQPVHFIPGSPQISIIDSGIPKSIRLCKKDSLNESFICKSV